MRQSKPTNVGSTVPDVETQIEIDVEEDVQVDLSINAYIMCKRHIKNNLVAPASTDFPFLDFTSVNEGGQIYHVRSYVDFQNGLGTMIRTNWNCAIVHDSIGDPHSENSWTLLDLQSE